MAVKRAYQKVEFRGRTYDRMTKAGVLHLEYFLGAVITITQGPFSTAVGASAGTHSGSGAIDFKPVAGYTVEQVLRAGRLAGWAIWHRPARPGLWAEHFHAIQIGNAEISDDARKQVQDFFAGLDGLASHAADPTWRPNPIVPFRFPLGYVDLANVRREAKAAPGKKKAVTGVKHIQRALNLKTGTTLKVDGVFGAKTKAAYGRFEKQNGGDGDGIPAPFALRLLGAARFRVGERSA